MSRLTLADVATSAAAAVGVPGFADTLSIGECQHVVVCLVDGMGWNLLRANADVAPTLAAMAGHPISAVFPTTTSVGLGSFGTGLLPGTHGLVGASFLLPELDQILNPLHWGASPTPVAVQPETTVFESVARSGVAMTTISPGVYRDSGLTRAVLRGSDYVDADDVAARVAGLRASTLRGDRTFSYVYWSDVDRTGHEFGSRSEQWRSALTRADDLVERLVTALPAGAALVVTADHGMLDCPAESRIPIEEDRRLTAGVVRIAGEPRARHLYVEPGAAHDVQSAWSEVLGDRALVLRRSELVERGYFGEVDVALADRIGDVMAVTTGNWMLSSRVDSTVSRLLGQHGATTDDEVLIPALIHRTD